MLTPTTLPNTLTELDNLGIYLSSLKSCISEEMKSSSNSKYLKEAMLEAIETSYSLIRLQDALLAYEI